MSRPAAPLAVPSLRTIAETVHGAIAHLDGDPTPIATIAHVDLHRETAELSLGFWELPPVTGHPMAPLVGFRAPGCWDAIGLISSGRLRQLDQPATEPTRVTSTVLADRSGEVASVLAEAGKEVRFLADPPVGVVPDVLARVLGLDTPPPEQTVASLVDLTWLDRLAGDLLARPPRGRSWRWLADRHPLRGTGPLPEAGDLAVRTAVYASGRSWFAVGSRISGTELPAARCGPPGGTTLRAGEWFDEGSLSRWILRDLPPAESLLPDLLAVLPPDVGESLLLALCEVELP